MGQISTSAGDWAGRPRYTPADFVALLWRERTLMLIVFAVIFAIGLGLALTMKKTYPTNASLLVRLGQEYVYEPRAGDAGRGAVPESDTVIQSELEILGSAQLKQRVIDRLGLARIFPKAAAKYAAAPPAGKAKIVRQSILAMEKSLQLGTAPDTPVIRLEYKADGPETAALVLNTLLEEYLIYRRGVLADPSSPAIEQQRREFEDRLADADSAYRDFLTNNRIGDFASEKQALSQLQAQLEQQRYATDSQLQDRQGRLAALDAQLSGVTPEIGLYRDLSSAPSEKLTTLKLQREDLLSRYKPDARPVQELDQQIRQLEGAVASGRTQGEGARRIGVNPVYQTLVTDKIQLTAEVAALRQSQAKIADQIEQLTERRLRLAELEPLFQDLSLNRDVLQANVRDFTVRAQQSRAAQEIAASGADNIRIVQRAMPPTQGSSLRKPVAALSFLFAAFTALCVGLLRVFVTPGIPTARAASRTLDLPVLGQAMMKAR